MITSRLHFASFALSISCWKEFDMFFGLLAISASISSIFFKTSPMVNNTSVWGMNTSWYNLNNSKLLELSSCRYLSNDQTKSPSSIIIDPSALVTESLTHDYEGYGCIVQSDHFTNTTRCLHRPLEVESFMKLPVFITF